MVKLHYTNSFQLVYKTDNPDATALRFQFRHVISERTSVPFLVELNTERKVVMTREELIDRLNQHCEHNRLYGHFKVLVNERHPVNEQGNIDSDLVNDEAEFRVQ